MQKNTMIRWVWSNYKLDVNQEYLSLISENIQSDEKIQMISRELCLLVFVAMISFLASKSQALSLKKGNKIKTSIGWGDVGFNGNPFIKTAQLEKLAVKSVQFERFYAVAPLCSPTRGSVLTVSNLERYGIFAPTWDI